MKIVSWNVNGIRACTRNGLKEWHSEFAPDVLCFQEVRAEEPDMEKHGCFPDDAYRHTWHPARSKKGYSGVGAWYRAEPLEIQHGLGIQEFDDEGRMLVMRYPGFWLFSGYFPNSGQGPERLAYKQRFYDALLERVNEIHARGEHVVITGDFNTAHTAIDLANPKANGQSPGFMPEERVRIDEYLAAGLRDVFRDRHPGESGHYTWWSNRPGVRERNIGWRIDYFLVSEGLVPQVQDVYILPQVKGSDHCPVVIELDDRLATR